MPNIPGYYGAYHAEEIVMQSLAAELRPTSSGQIVIGHPKDRPPCPSCEAMLLQFRQRLPFVHIVIDR